MCVVVMRLRQLQYGVITPSHCRRQAGRVCMSPDSARPAHRGRALWHGPLAGRLDSALAQASRSGGFRRGSLNLGFR